jgi:predicted transglutaminase-like cysteine proteinase
MLRLGTVILALALSTKCEASDIEKWEDVTFDAPNAYTDIAVGKPEQIRIGHINREVNYTIHYKYDVVDHWANPSETLKTHEGDCEDIAILKIQALLNIGIDASRLHLVLVRDPMHRAHAVAQVDNTFLDYRTSVMIPIDKYPGRIIAVYQLRK